MYSRYKMNIVIPIIAVFFIIIAILLTGYFTNWFHTSGTPTPTISAATTFDDTAIDTTTPALSAALASTTTTVTPLLVAASPTPYSTGAPCCVIAFTIRQSDLLMYAVQSDNQVYQRAAGASTWTLLPSSAGVISIGTLQSLDTTKNGKLIAVSKATNAVVMRASQDVTSAWVSDKGSAGAFDTGTNTFTDFQSFADGTHYTVGTGGHIVKYTPSNAATYVAIPQQGNAGWTKICFRKNGNMYGVNATHQIWMKTAADDASVWVLTSYTGVDVASDWTNDIMYYADVNGAIQKMS